MWCTHVVLRRYLVGTSKGSVDVSVSLFGNTISAPGGTGFPACAVIILGASPPEGSTVSATDAA